METRLCLEEIIESVLKTEKSIIVKRRLKSLFRFSITVNLTVVISFVGILLLKLITGVYLTSVFTDLCLSFLLAFSVIYFLLFLANEITDLLLFKENFKTVCLVYEDEENIIS